jgi:type I restriction enzyme S subunit
MEIIGGGTPSTKVKEYWDGDIPWISVKDFNNDRRFVSSTERSITQLGLHNSSTKMLERGDLIISARGTVGQVAQLSSEMAFNQTSYGLKAKPNMITNDFLYYLLRNMGDEIRGSTHGTVFDTITRRTFDTLCAKLPPLPTQKVITDTLSCLDAKIELNNKINENLEAQAQAIFKSWFADFEPFLDGEFVESELGLIPKGWKIGSLLDKINLLGGGTPKRSIQEYWMGNISWLSGKDVSASNRTFVLETEEKITELGLAKSSTKVVPRFGTVISARGTVGKICIVSKPMAFSQTNYGVVPKDEQSYFWAYLLTCNAIRELKSGAYGSVFDTITTRNFASHKIPLPPDSIISDLNAMVSPMFELMLNNVEQTSRLLGVRDILLPKLMSGEIEVPVD